MNTIVPPSGYFKTQGNLLFIDFAFVSECIHHSLCSESSNYALTLRPLALVETLQDQVESVFNVNYAACCRRMAMCV